MSHLVTIEARLRDPAAIAAACQRLGLPQPAQGTAKLYSGEASGLLVQLPGWEFPVIIDPASGVARYDNYEGRWGEQAQLSRLLQCYAVEKAKLEGRQRGYPVSEQALPDGSIDVQILEGCA